MKKIILPLFFLLFAGNIYSQNKPILYNFAETPQTLMLNPGAETNFRYHLGIPMFSGISMGFGSSGAVVADLLLKDNIDFNIKFSNVINQLEITDDLSINMQMEIFNVGYRLNDKTYLTGGFYGEMDFIGYFPKDIAILLYEGSSSYLNKSFSFSQLNFNMEILGVLHAGITRTVNKKLTVGARLKIYSSSFNLRTRNNSGTFTTTLGDNNIYRHALNNININIQTSGLIVNDNFIDNPQNIIRNTLMSGNLGLGIDLGFSYRASKQLEFTGSLLDVGFIKYSKNNKATTINGTYQTQGVNFEYDPTNPIDYWQEFENEFEEKIITADNENNYTTFRSAKLNLGLRHSFGEVRINRDCFDPYKKDYYSNAVGLQLYTIFRPLQAQFALTGFFEKAITQNIFTKVTYTIDRYSATNVGLGLSTRVGWVQMYGVIDNIFKIRQLEAANNFSFQLGMNLIIN